MPSRGREYETRRSRESTLECHGLEVSSYIVLLHGEEIRPIGHYKRCQLVDKRGSINFLQGLFASFVRPFLQTRCVLALSCDRTACSTSSRLRTAAVAAEW